jgi:hypothetical protein
MVGKTMQRIGIINRKKNQKGTAMAELPGALMILLIFILFPMFDLITMAAKYAACYQLNNAQINEAALLPSSSAKANSGPIIKVIPENWNNTGIGLWVSNEAGFPQTKVRYDNGQTAANGEMDKNVYVATTFSIQPMLHVDNRYLPQIPGLNAPWSFTIESGHPMEDPANAG